ncbi:MAG: peptide-methionine (S)-S-oxide reductase MsrA [Pseudomonadota bacterium]
MFGFMKAKAVTPETALPGRSAPIETAATHFLSGAPLKGPHPAGSEMACFGMGCFWGAERLFWETPGVLVTMVGYAGGYTPNPTYREVCSGQTMHTEVVGVVFDPAKLPYEALLRVFWEGHDPTQGMRQGNDVGTQYRSALFTYSPEQLAAARATRDAYETRLKAAGFGPITTEIGPAPEFFFAEDYHQQYLAKNPAGYCGIGGVGVSCPVGVNA